MASLMISFRRLLVGRAGQAPSAEQLEPRQLLDGLVAFDGRATQIPSAPTNVQYTIANDFDNDGKDEVVAFGTTRMSFLLYEPQNANSFYDRLVTSPTRSRDYASPGVAPIVLDANGDGSLDLVVGKWLAFNDGSGAFPSPWFSVGPDRGAFWVAQTLTMDFEGDGDRDVIMRYNDQALVFLENDGRGNLTERATRTFAAGISVTPSIVEGFAGATGETLVVEQLQDGNRSLWAYDLRGSMVQSRQLNVPSAALAPVIEAPGLKFFDADRDGILDVLRVAVNPNRFGGFEFGNNILRGRADGSFGPEEFFTQSDRLVDTADLDDDGVKDMVLATSGSNFSVVLGTFDQRSAFRSSDISVSTRRPIFADIDGDNDLDALSITNTSSLSASLSLTSLRSVTITPWTAPMANVFAYELPPNAQSTRGWSIFADTDRSGTWTQADQRVELSDFTWNGNGRVPGVYREFAVNVYDLSSSRGEEIIVRERFYRQWTSVYMPEGWRNPQNVNEYLPLLNTSGVPIDYRIMIHYAEGEQHQEFATGTIAPGSRGGVTLAERGRPSSIRPNEAYSIEVQATGYLSAAFTHYDNFGDPSRGQAAGENLRGTWDTSADFGIVNADDMHFLTFYTPRNTIITVLFMGEDGTELEHVIQAGAGRRSGVFVRNVFGIEPGKRYFARAYASQVPNAFEFVGFYGTKTSYETDSATLIWGTTTSLGATEANYSHGLVVPARAGLSNTVTLSGYGTPSFQSRRYEFDVLPNNAAPRPVTIDVPGRTLRNVNLSDYKAPGSQFVMARYLPNNNGQIVNSLVSRDTLRRDATATTVKTSTYHTFAEGYLEPGNDRFEATFAIFNPSSLIDGRTTPPANVTLRFFTTDGRNVSTTLTIPASNGTLLNLRDVPALMNLPGLRWFGTEVSSNTPITATFTHWDRNQPGGVAF